MALDHNDIQQISTIIKENNKELTKKIVGEVVVQVGEFMDSSVLSQIEKVSNELIEVKKILTTLPNRDDVARIVADAKGGVVSIAKDQDKKVNLHIDFNKANKGLNDEQWKSLHAIKVFPTVEV